MQAIDRHALNQLTIRGTGQQFTRLFEALERPLTGGWRRDCEAESRLRGLGLSRTSAHCFACTAKGRRPAAAVWLEPCGKDALSVASIVPLSKRELSKDEHNLILAEFDSQVLQPARAGLAIETEVTLNSLTLETYLSSEAIRRLKAFSAMASKSLLHPADCQRWHEFIVQTHLEGADIDPLLLDQWLAEQQWPDEQRQHLIGEYETSRSVLAAYDEERLEKCPR